MGGVRLKYAKRNDLICRLWRRGHSIRDIAQIVGITPHAAYAVIERERHKGKDVPLRYTRDGRTKLWCADLHSRATLIRQAMSAIGLDPEEDLSVKKAANLLGISPFTVRKAISKGEISAWMYKHTYYMRAADVLDWGVRV